MHSIDIEASNPILESIFSLELKVPLLNLSFLRLSRPREELPDRNSSSLISPILQGACYRLHTLELHGVAVPVIPAFITPHLRVLYVTNLRVDRALHISEILEILDICSSLEHLVLVNGGPRLDDDPSMTETRIVKAALPRLRVFHVHQLDDRSVSLSPLEILLQNISIPDTTQVDVAVRCLVFSVHDVERRIQEYLQSFSNHLGVMRHITSIHFRVFGPFSRIEGWSASLAQLDSPPAPDFHAHFLTPGRQSSDWPGQQPADLPFFKIFAAAFSFCPVQTVFLSFHTEFMTTYDWRELFIALDSETLSELTIQNADPSAPFFTLWMIVDIVTALQYSSISPGLYLEKLHLRGVHWQVSSEQLTNAVQVYLLSVASQGYRPVEVLPIWATLGS